MPQIFLIPILLLGLLSGIFLVRHPAVFQPKAESIEPVIIFNPSPSPYLKLNIKTAFFKPSPAPSPTPSPTLTPTPSPSASPSPSPTPKPTPTPTPAPTKKAKLSLSPASKNFNRNCSFTLAVNLDTGWTPTTGTDVILKYDSEKFSAIKIIEGSLYPDYPNPSIDNEVGEVLISGLTLGSTFSGIGEFAKINFKVKPSAELGSSQIRFDFDSGNKKNPLDSNVVGIDTKDILDSVINGTYTIGSGGC